MADQLVFDDEAARNIEAIYLTRDAVRRRAIVKERLAAAPGERVLDVGCGPGFYCVELVEHVGQSGSLVGVDSSPAMLALAEGRCSGYPNIELLEGGATSLPVADESFDAAISVQVQEYVADLDTSLAELHRVVRPGGRVAVFDVDWETLSIYSPDPERSARVLRAWDEHLANPALPQTLGRRLRDAGFEGVQMSAHEFVTDDFDDQTYGAALIPFIGLFVAGREGLTAADAQGWVDEQRQLGDRGEFYFAVLQYCFTARKPAAP